MPTAEIKILCNQIIEEVKLISVGVDDIAALGGGESKVIDRLKELGLLEIDGGQVRFTRRGMEVSNVALAEFLL